MCVCVCVCFFRCGYGGRGVRGDVVSVIACCDLYAYQLLGVWRLGAFRVFACVVGSVHACVSWSLRQSRSGKGRGGAIWAI